MSCPEAVQVPLASVHLGANHNNADILILKDRTQVRDYLEFLLRRLGIAEELSITAAGEQTSDFITYLAGLTAAAVADLKAGQIVRTVYPASEFRRPDVVEQSYDPTREAGEVIRSVPSVSNSLKIFDRRLAIVGVGDQGGAVVVRDPALVETYYRMFETMWDAARDEPTHRQPLEAFDASVLDLLANGATDEQISRALHASERTVRRRVSAMMDSVSARSRFQLGQRAHEVRRPPDRSPLAD